MAEGGQLSRLKRLKALAERGIGGEKENAQRLLDKLCEKYGILPREVEGSDERKLRWFRFRKGAQFRKLLGQCIFKTVGKGRPTYKHTHSRIRELGTECTAAEGIEIELDYDFYADALKEEMTRLVEMFIQKNDLFPPNCDVAKDSCMTEADMLLYRGIKKKSRVLLLDTGGKEGLMTYDLEEDEDEDGE